MSWILIFTTILGHQVNITHTNFPTKEQCVLVAEQTARVFARINYQPQFKMNWSCVGVENASSEHPNR